MRGMVKWIPFNALMNEEDISLIEKEKRKEDMPILMSDKIEDINEVIKVSINEKLFVSVKYFSNKIININGYIEKINKQEKYILIGKTKIYFKDIIDVSIL